MYMYICICIYVYVYMYMYICIYVYVYMYMYICICRYVYVYIPTHRHTHRLDWIGLESVLPAMEGPGPSFFRPEALEVARHGKQKHWDLDGEVGPNSCWFDGDLIIFKTKHGEQPRKIHDTW